MVAAWWWAGGCGDRSRCVQGTEGAPSPTVWVSLCDDQNDGWDTAPISGPAHTPGRKTVAGNQSR